MPIYHAKSHQSHAVVLSVVVVVVVAVAVVVAVVFDSFVRLCFCFRFACLFLRFHCFFFFAFFVCCF